MEYSDESWPSGQQFIWRWGGEHHPDGLTLIFVSNRPGGSGGVDLWAATREMKEDDWGTPVNLGSTVNSSSGDNNPSISSDGLEIYFTSDRDDWKIWVTRRATTNELWGAPVSLASTVNSGGGGLQPSISADGLMLLFSSWRPGGYGKADIWVTTRATTDSPWAEPMNLGPTVNSSGLENEPPLSPDGSILYFNSDRPGGIGSWDIWQAPIIPIVDFNGDGNIDTDDLIILIGFWGQNDPLCDIGPTPLGDGIVDIKDLEVFMIYWEQENIPEIPEEEL